MRRGLWLALIFFAIPVWSLKLSLLATTTIPNGLKFEKTVIGGLSGIFYEGSTGILTAVSDDKGTESEPRLYEFAFKFENKILSVVPKAVHFIKKKDQKRNNVFVDFEGMTVLPWGNFLISSEGNSNLKPRVPPEIMDVKKDGTWVRSYDLPEKFKQQAVGKQTQGIKNNKGFEGVTKTPSSDKFFLMNEESLLQDAEGVDLGPVRLLVYDASEAWIIKPTKEYAYWPEKGNSDSKTGDGRVSELLAISADEFLVLERTLKISSQKLYEFVCKIFKANIGGATDVSGMPSLKAVKNLVSMKKELILDLESLKSQIGNIENFEGLAFGPDIDKKKTLIVISDNNFNKAERTLILLFEIQE